MFDIIGSVGSMFTGAKNLLGSVGTGLGSIWDTAKSWGGTGIDGLTSGLKSITAGTNWVRDSLKDMGNNSFFTGAKGFFQTIGDGFKAGNQLFGDAFGLSRNAMGLYGLGQNLFGGQPNSSANLAMMTQSMRLQPGMPGNGAFAQRLAMEQMHQGNMGNMAAMNYAQNLAAGLAIGNFIRG